MRGVRLLRVAALCAAMGISASIGAAGWAFGQDGQDQAAQQEGDQPGRRRSARLVRPWSELQDLTPRQEATIREIRTDILNQKDELDRLERQRIMEVLTEAQRQRVAEIEAERTRQQEERRQRDGDGASTRSADDDQDDN